MNPANLSTPPFRVAPRDRFLFQLLLSIDDANGNLHRMKEMAIRAYVSNKPLYQEASFLPAEIVNQVVDSLEKDGYIAVIDTKPDPEPVYKITDRGREQLRLLSYRIAKETEGKNKPAPISELENIFRANEIVLLPLQTSFEILNPNPTATFDLLFCPFYPDKEAIVKIPVPRVNLAQNELLVTDPEHTIFVAFATMLTLSGVEVRIPKINNAQPTLDPVTKEPISFPNDFCLETFDPRQPPTQIPFILEADIDYLIDPEENVDHEL